MRILKSAETTGDSAEIKIRATGIEPVSHAWEARVLPLNDARLCKAGQSIVPDKA